MASRLLGVGTHPDLPDTFVHFTGRPRSASDKAPDFATGTAEERMVRILQEGRLRAAPDYRPVLPVICFSEPTEAARRVMLRDGVTFRGPYAPWGLIFDRAKLIDAGARPVLHMSKDEVAAVEGLDARLRSRIVRYDPGQSDWLHEREWRIVPDNADPALQLTTEGLVVGVIVGEQGWTPPPISTTGVTRFADPAAYPAELRALPIGDFLGGVYYKDSQYSATADQLARWWWNGQELVEDGVFDMRAQASEDARREHESLLRQLGVTSTDSPGPADTSATS